LLREQPGLRAEHPDQPLPRLLQQRGNLPRERKLKPMLRNQPGLRPQLLRQRAELRRAGRGQHLLRHRSSLPDVLRHRLLRQRDVLRWRSMLPDPPGLRQHLLRQWVILLCRRSLLHYRDRLWLCGQWGGVLR
jgi:hypothetical protein